MGGAQPLAVTLNDGVADRRRRRVATGRRVEHGYLDEYTTDLDAALARVAARAAGEALSVGVVGNAAEVFPNSCAAPRRRAIDIVTDQTSAHDPLAYLPIGISVGMEGCRGIRPGHFTDRARASMAAHVEAMVGFQDAGAAVFDYGNSIRREAELGGFDRAFAFPGSCPPTSGRCSPRVGAVPLGRAVGRSGGHREDRPCRRGALPRRRRLHRWLEKAGETVHFEGLPARICWLGYKERHLAGLRFNEMVASGELAGRS
jgi:urocanate hydratase